MSDWLIEGLESIFQTSHNSSDCSAARSAIEQITSLRKQVAELGAALEPFAVFGANNVDEEGWNGHEQKASIDTWFGPSEFRAARDALSMKPSEQDPGAPRVEVRDEVAAARDRVIEQTGLLVAFMCSQMGHAGYDQNLRRAISHFRQVTGRDPATGLTPEEKKV